MNEDFEAVLRATTKIRKLMALAAGNDNQHEASLAMAQAQRLAARYGVDMHGLTPLVEETKSEKLRKGRAVTQNFASAFGRAIGGVEDDRHEDVSFAEFTRRVDTTDEM